METTFKFEMKDWLAFNAYYIDNARWVKQRKIVFVFPLILLMFSLIDIIDGKFSTPTLLVYFIACIIWYIYMPKRFKKNTLKRVKIMLEDGDNSGLLGEHKIVLHENAITRITPGSEYKVYWHGIKKIAETNLYYFLFDTATTAIIIPKDAFKDTAIKDLFKTYTSDIKIVN